MKHSPVAILRLDGHAISGEGKPPDTHVVVNGYYGELACAIGPANSF